MDLTLYKKIGDQYEIDNDRTVRSVLERMRKRLSVDRDLAREMKKLKDLIKSAKNGLDLFTLYWEGT